MSRWTMKYDNDTGLNDEAYWEWWTVTDGSRSFKCEADETSAEWLCELLNRVAGDEEG